MEQNNSIRLLATYFCLEVNDYVFIKKAPSLVLKITLQSNNVVLLFSFWSNKLENTCSIWIQAL